MIYIALAAFILLTILVEVEFFGFAILELACLGIALWIGHKYSWCTLPHITLNDAAVFATIYVFIGIVWSLLKWLIYLYQYRRDLRVLVLEWKVKNDRNADVELGDVDRKAMWHWLPEKFRIKPKASEHSGNIVGWMTFWPCSVVGFVLNDPVRRFFTFVFNLLRSSYQRLADHVVKESDFR